MVIDAKEFYEHTPVRIIDGQVSGHAQELKKRFLVTVIEAKESFEHTPVLTIGQSAGHAHELKKRFLVSVIEAKESFEHTHLCSLLVSSLDTPMS